MYTIFVGKAKDQQKNDVAFLHQYVSEILVEAGLCPAVFMESRAVFVNKGKANIEKGFALGFPELEDCRRAACWLKEHLRHGLHNLPAREAACYLPFAESMEAPDLKTAVKTWKTTNKEKKARAFIFEQKDGYQVIGHQATK